VDSERVYDAVVATPEEKDGPNAAAGVQELLELVLHENRRLFCDGKGDSLVSMPGNERGTRHHRRGETGIDIEKKVGGPQVSPARKKISSNPFFQHVDYPLGWFGGSTHILTNITRGRGAILLIIKPRPRFIRQISG